MYSTGIKNTFTGLEMFRFAELMEEEGYNAYTNGADYTTGKTKEFFLFAARQEFIHKEKFAKLSTELITNLKTDIGYIFDDEVTKYLTDLIKDRVFNKKDQRNGAFKDLKSALTYSLKYEKITISIYTQMYGNVLQKDISKILSIIIEEEKVHVSYLLKLLQEITA